MAKDNNRESILQAVKERVRQSEELQLTQMIVTAMGERRNRDLSDIISQIEQDRGWAVALMHLSRANQIPYTLPIGAGPNHMLIEELKYREMIFTLLECNGLEPVPITTEEILSELKNEDSLIDASQLLRTDCESLASKQIESGDTLFFDLTNADSSISANIGYLLEKIQSDELANLILEKQDDTINILPLWYLEKGRQTLSQLGIKGTSIDSERFEIVISVIQQNLPTTESTELHVTDKQLNYPSNPHYQKLLTSIINHDIESLSSQSSRHSFHSLKFMLENTLDIYENSQSSSAFWNILSCVNAHVRVRTPESVMLLENLAHSKDTRVATAAITGLGNFYNEASVSALVDLLCRAKNNEVVNTAIRAIKNVSKRCLETKYIVRNATESKLCTNIGHLKRLYKDIWKEVDDYYL
ncbi:HEAT repeat domain-containing protein [Candidatus Thorarchaeota archaeon]|nr:MAG: HEAT repeat domain-containing protein [Candidatus Thorarchaeota archaeon]